MVDADAVQYSEEHGAIGLLLSAFPDIQKARGHLGVIRADVQSQELRSGAQNVKQQEFRCGYT